MKLGEGTYGSVEKENGKAVKYVHKARHHLREYIMISVLKDCENVVNCSGVDFDKLSITMDLYDTNLKSYLFGNTLTLKQKEFIIIEIAKGLHQIHSKKISHADLKLDNILIKVDDSNNLSRVVLGDCGLSCDHKYARINCTGEDYRDKDLIYDGKHDIFSFGVCVYEIITRTRARDTDQSVMMSKSQNITNPHYKALLIKIFGPRHLRPSTSDILKHLKCNYDCKGIPEIFNKPEEIKTLVNYGNFKNMKIRDIFIELYNEYNLVRANKGFNILTYMLIKYNINPRCYPDWISVIVYILYNLYNNRDKIHIKEIQDFEISKHKDIVNKIVTDDQFIHIMI